MRRFEDRVVVVTGGASGIGAAAVDRFLREGARVVVADIDLPELEDMSRRLAAEGASFTALPTDVSDPASVEELRARTLETYGRVDVAVVNAGVWGQSPVLDLTLADWDRVLGVNLRGAFITAQCFARAMADQGAGGAIVMTASTNSFLAEPDSAHYNASKGGVAMLVKSMAVDLAERGIRVNGIAPGTLRTGITSSFLGTGNAPVPGMAFPPLRRWGEPEECAAVIAFLASSDASYMTGELVVVDGGQIALNGVVSS